MNRINIFATIAVFLGLLSVHQSMDAAARVILGQPVLVHQVAAAGAAAVCALCVGWLLRDKP